MAPSPKLSPAGDGALPQQQQQQPTSQSSSQTQTPGTSPHAVFLTPNPQKPNSPNETNNNLLQLPHHAGDLALARSRTPVEIVKRAFAIRPAGESGRSGIHPVHFFRNIFRSSSWASRMVNVLWPVVPAAIAVRYATPHNNLVIFILSYLAMVPCANLIGFAGQELGRKFPHVLGIITETT